MKLPHIQKCKVRRAKLFDDGTEINFDSPSRTKLPMDADAHDPTENKALYGTRYVDLGQIADATPERRGIESRRMRHKFDNAVPVVCRERGGKHHGLLVPKTLIVGQLRQQMERCINIKNKQSLEIGVAGVRLSPFVGLEQLDMMFCSGDGFLYLDVIVLNNHKTPRRFNDIDFDICAGWPIPQRRLRAQRIISAEPGWVRIIIENRRGSSLPKEVSRVLQVRGHMTKARFVEKLRREIEVDNNRVVDLYVNSVERCPGGDMMSAYLQCADCDGFLRLKYDAECRFGGDEGDDTVAAAAAGGADGRPVSVDNYIPGAGRCR